MTPTPPDTIAIIGLGLIGSSVARAVRSRCLAVRITGFDRDERVSEQVRQLGVVDLVTATAGDAVRDARLIILCVPVGAMEEVARSLDGHLMPGAILSDVGSSKRQVASSLRKACPSATIVPVHPIAGSERSGAEAGRADLFEDRWCIVTPVPDCPPEAIQKITSFWSSIGARVELMDAKTHDLILAATSHVPHLLAFSTVLALMDMEAESGTEIMTFSGGGLRDFTRIAAADPVVWRDTFLSNCEAVFEVLDRYRLSLDRLRMMMKEERISELTETLSAIRNRRLKLDVGSRREA